MIFDGVVSNEFDLDDGVQNVILCEPSTCPLLFVGLKPGSPGHPDGVEACPCNGSDGSDNGVAP